MLNVSQRNFYHDHYARWAPEAYGSINARAYRALADHGAKKVLDIGCGGGASCVLLRDILGVDEIWGVDIAEEAIKSAKQSGVLGSCVNIDEEPLPFADNFFDGVFCGHIIEHVFDPDHLLDEIHRVLKPEGICVLATPNLASWYDRLALLFGFQPLCTEVSLKHAVGYPFPSVFRGDPRSGHLRLFTLPALKELVAIHRFTITEVFGTKINADSGHCRYWKLIASVVNTIPLSPSLCSAMTIVMKKSPVHE